MHNPTPLLRSFLDEARLKSTDESMQIWLKMENAQASGSFKLRGIGRLCQAQFEAGARVLVSSSGGNAGYSAAWCAKILGLDMCVVVPQSTSETVISQLKQLGAEVEIHGESWQEAHALAEQWAQKPLHALIHPFDHPLIWQGHASLVHEIQAQGVKPTAMLLSVGGGGLLAGVAQGLKDCGWQDVPIYAVETDGAASLAAAQQAGRPVTLDKIETVASTLGAKRVCDQAFEVLNNHPVHCLQVSDAAALAACERFKSLHRILVEPACGASYAALDSPEFQGALQQDARVVVIVCGGIAGF